MLSNIFSLIKNEELPILERQIIEEKGKAEDAEQTDSLKCFYEQINLAKNCVNTVYKKIVQKLKTDKLNHFIKKNSRKFLNFVDELVEDVFEIITAQTAKTNSAEENDFVEKTYQGTLLELKNEIILQWNNEAIIQSHVKRREIFNGVMKGLIVPLLIGLVLTITGVIINQCIIRTNQDIVEKGGQEASSIIIEKIKNSPEVKNEASYLYRILKDMDGEQVRKLLRTLYLKFS